MQLMANRKEMRYNLGGGGVKASGLAGLEAVWGSLVVVALERR